MQREHADRAQAVPAEEENAQGSRVYASPDPVWEGSAGSAPRPPGYYCQYDMDSSDEEDEDDDDDADASSDDSTVTPPLPFVPAHLREADAAVPEADAAAAATEADVDSGAPVSSHVLRNARKRRFSAVAASAPTPRPATVRVLTNAFCNKCDFQTYSCVTTQRVDVALELRLQNFGACGKCKTPMPILVQVEVQCSRCASPDNGIAKYECVYASACPIVGAIPCRVTCARCM